MGDGCELPCKFGIPERSDNGNWFCHCNEPCYNGLGCDLLCSNQTTALCINDTCDCGFEGGRGEFCEVGGCPGEQGLDCTGHGECNLATGICFCDSGWVGLGCEIPDCPGTPDCNERGVCDPSDPTYCRNCTDGWMGAACEIPCVYGIQDPMDSGNCSCEPCYHGVSCDMMCASVGNCTDDGYCVCPFEGGRGTFCDEPGCPGYGEDCTGHGTCILGQCLCNEGWVGIGCEEPDCPGDPDCNNRGICYTSTAIPECQDCIEGWMGPACEIQCGPEHGQQDPPNSGTCKCKNDCWHGISCHDFCSSRGECVNGTCDCAHEAGLNAGWWGMYCHQCICNTGWVGSGCHIPDCPGEPDCNARGTCDRSYDPPTCTNCDDGWIGAACELPCVNGTAQPDFTCSCHPCYGDAGFNQECNNHDSCIYNNNSNQTCDCNVAWWGDTCTVRGCPGVGESCSKHGFCNFNDQECFCYSGWKGNDCNTPDCPGTPDCSDSSNI
uniref:Tenascin-X-like n=1 Tax=Saccoglossus kowalevskii TaxID=10224 RepID=A0ABM0MXN4_SACKO|nr:PREDICTED: tenascin-X-like [Saccoglossus kowalevskii]